MSVHRPLTRRIGVWSTKLEVIPVSVTAVGTTVVRVHPMVLGVNNGAAAVGALQALTASATVVEAVVTGADVTLQALTGSAYCGAHADVTLQALTGSATAVIQATVSAAVSLQTLTGSATVVSGAVVSAAVSLQALTGSAYCGAHADVTLLPLTGLATVTAGAVVAATGTLQPLTGSATVSADTTINAAGTLQPLQATPTIWVAVTLPALTAYAVVNEIVAVTYEAYAINLTTGAVTHYTNYPFDNILRFGNKFYGVGPTGVFELSGDMDLTVPIDAHIKTFQTKFDTLKMKRLPYVYSSGRSDGGVTIGVTADEGPTYDYQSQWGNVAGSTNHRTKVGDGIRGVYYSFDVSNTGGGSLQLDSIEVSSIPTARRV